MLAEDAATGTAGALLDLACAGFRARLRVPLQPLQVAAQIGGRLVAQVAVFFQSLPDNLLELRRQRGIQLRRWSRIEFKNGVEDHGGSGAGKRKASGRHLVDHDAKGKQIGARIEFFPARLLRRHVGDGPDGRSRDW